jgi:hypothetical protein
MAEGENYLFLMNVLSQHKPDRMKRSHCEMGKSHKKSGLHKVQSASDNKSVTGG